MYAYCAAQEVEHLTAREPDSGLVRVVVDTPKGSRNKYKYDETLGLYRLSKVLPVGIAFPYDFGFIPSTRAEDGDPLDVLVLGEEAMFPGCLVTVRLVGVIQAEQTEHGKTFRNDRLMGAIETSVNRPAIQTLADLRTEHLDEIEYFFMAYNHLEGRHFKPIGRHGPALAEQLLADGIRQFDNAKGSRNGEQHTPENDHRR
jgi:inorganic pyrophosphatase